MSTVAEYLNARLAALGLKHLFCVAGNYTAEFLLSAQPTGKIERVTTRNEQEAGQAADAYARLNGIGCCCTTYGVGSLSAAEAIAGAYVEFCPVVLINGGPPTEKARQLVEQGVLFAHAIDLKRTDEALFSPITVAQAVLTSGRSAASEIDRVLKACLAHRRPVYLEVRQRIWNEPCELPAEPYLPLQPDSPTSDEAKDQAVATEAAITAVLEKFQAAKAPLLWGGEMLQRLRVEASFQSILDRSEAGLKYTTTLMAKGLVSEQRNRQRFLGVYDSAFAPQEVREVVESSDCLLALGTTLSDFYGGIVAKSYERMILASPGAVRIGKDLYLNVPLQRFMERLADRWPSGLTLSSPAGADMLLQRRLAWLDAAFDGDESQSLTWKRFFARMNAFVRSDMLVMVDTSFALFMAAEIPLPDDARFVAQAAWLSIGYTTGGAVGAALASPQRRPIVLVGDGGFQMKPQAFSTLVELRKGAIVFVLNNGIYGIEQYLVDQQILPTAERFYGNEDTQPSYFDILPRWDYVKLAEAFGGRGFLATTPGELNRALRLAETLEDTAVLIDVRLDPRDLPPEVAATINRPVASGLQATSSPRIATAAFN